jgi:alpha-1,3/alpha-1,6-mannosyltransferase
VDYHRGLVAQAEALGLRHATARTVSEALAVPEQVDVLFLLSVPTSIKETLLRHASLLVYTPSNEHFGIVPVEAMQYGVPVLAANSSGPLETVVHEKTGWLVSSNDVQAWSEVMEWVLDDQN